MQEGIEIIKSNCGMYQNALHAQFMNRAYGVFQGIEPQKVNLTEGFMAEWRGNIDTEIEIGKQVTASLDTRKMAEADQKQDGLLSFLFQSGRVAALSPYEAEREAGEAVTLVTDKYAGIQGESADAESAHIKGLLIDLRSEDVMPHIRTLKLEQVLDDIERAAQAYDELRDRRSDERVARRLPAAKQVRKYSDACLEHAILMTRASYFLVTDEAVKAEILLLADRLNQRIAEAKTAYNQSMAQKGTEGMAPGTVPGEDFPATDEESGSEPQPGTDPDAGDTPGDTQQPEGGSTPDGNTPGTPDPDQGGGDDDEEVVG